MVYQITLSDEDYAALTAAAASSGEPIEMLVHQVISERFASAKPNQRVGDYRYPTNEPDSPEDEAEDERLAASIGSEKPWLSDLVIEDRGPR